MPQTISSCDSSPVGDQPLATVSAHTVLSDTVRRTYRDSLYCAIIAHTVLAVSQCSEGLYASIPRSCWGRGSFLTVMGVTPIQEMACRVSATLQLLSACSHRMTTTYRLLYYVIWYVASCAKCDWRPLPQQGCDCSTASCSGGSPLRAGHQVRRSACNTFKLFL